MSDDEDDVAVPDDPTHLLPCSGNKFLQDILKHWGTPENPNELSISMIIAQLILFFQLFEQVQVQVQDNIFVPMIMKYYFDTISTICCVSFSLSLTDLSGILVIGSYFKEITTFELSHNNLVLCNMLPFLEGLVQIHPVRAFIFNRNIMYTGEFELSRNSLLKILTLLFTQVEHVDLSACEIDSVLIGLIVSVLNEVCKNGTLKLIYLVLNSNYIDESDFVLLLKTSNEIPYLSLIVEDCFCPEDPLGYEHVISALGEQPIVRFGTIDDDESVISEEIINTIKKCMDTNVSLLQFVSPSKVVNEIVKFYTDRNVRTFYLPCNTTCFSQDFIKLLIAFVLLNEIRGSNNHESKLPLHICIKIFGFFTPLMFMPLEF